MILFYLVTAFFSHIIPYKIATYLTERIADGAYRTTHKGARRVVMRNLSQVFPEKSEKELASMTLKIFRNFGRFIYEFLLLPRINRDNMDQWLTPVGVERVEEGLRRGKGVVVLTGHLGNWELGAAFLALKDYPVTVVALDSPSRFVADFFNRRRQVHRIRVASLSGAIRESFRALRANGVVALLGDRNYTGGGETIAFFGRETSIPSGVLTVASKTESLVVPAFAVREGEKYRIYFEPPLELQKGQAGRGALRVNLAAWVRVFESYVRRYPEQWFVFSPVWEIDALGGQYASPSG